MSKNRLDEATVRRFMGLAGVGALGENFIDRLREEDDMPAPEEEMPVGEPEAGLEPDAAGPPAEADVEVATEMAQDVADAVATALTDALSQHGVEVTTGEAAPAGVPEAPAVDAGLPAEEPVAPEGDLGGEEEEGDLGDLEEAGIELVDDEDIVKEVARRVASRLMRESRRQRTQPKKAKRQRTQPKKVKRLKRRR